MNEDKKVYTTSPPAQVMGSEVALRALMSKLADLLDEDHFAACEDIVRRSSIEPPLTSVDARAEELARRLWGYFNGDSSGSSSAMQWFDNNKSLGSPAHIIDLCRAALSAPEVDHG